MDGFVLTHDGVKRLANRKLKAKLGFSVVQEFPAAAAAATVKAADDAQIDVCK